MKKIVITGFIIFCILIAYVTKPDDKTCIIETVKIVWGRSMASQRSPLYYEQFMDLTSKSVTIEDYFIIKRMKYAFATETRTVAYGAFNKVFRAG